LDFFLVVNPIEPSPTHWKWCKRDSSEACGQVDLAVGQEISMQLCARAYAEVTDSAFMITLVPEVSLPPDIGRDVSICTNLT